MAKLTTETSRRIIENFENEIKEAKIPGPNPTTAVIFFRRDHIDKIARDVWLVPTNLLRFRKDNGRIASEVESYETLKKPLQED